MRTIEQYDLAHCFFSSSQVFSNGEPCILFQARKLSLRYERQKQLDLTERAFSVQKPVDTSQSVCRQDKATYVAVSLSIQMICTILQNLSESDLVMRHTLYQYQYSILDVLL